MSAGERFGAPWSRSLAVSSAGLVVMFAGMSALAAWQIPAAPDDVVTRTLAIAAPLAMIAVVALFMVRGYRLAPGTLVIERLLWKTEVPLAGLRAAQIDPKAMDASMTLLGNGGGFVFAGRMKNKRLGHYRCWVNDPARAVVLRFPDRVLVVAPADPQAFVSAVMAQPIRPAAS